MTRVARTLFDLAAVLPLDIFEEALDDALRRDLVTPGGLRRRLEDTFGHARGCAAMRELITERQSDERRESELEDRLFRRLRRARLPLPICQYNIYSEGQFIARVDFAYPDVRLALETDSARWHASRRRWESDLAKGNALTDIGWRVIRFTARDLRVRSEQVIGLIARAREGWSRTRRGRARAAPWDPFMRQ